MEFISGISKKEYVSIKELAQGSCDGKTVRMEGMVHAVRDMGDVRFVILRKAEGLVQCVYEEKTAGFALGELKDESAVRVARLLRAQLQLLCTLVLYAHPYPCRHDRERAGGPGC